MEEKDNKRKSLLYINSIKRANESIIAINKWAAFICLTYTWHTITTILLSLENNVRRSR